MYAQGKADAGHTLLELITVFSIVALMLVMTTSVGSRWHQRYVLLTAEKKVFHALKIAKSSAYATHQTIVVCPKGRLTSEGDCPVNQAWQSPWLIAAVNTQRQIRVLQQLEPFHRKVQISYRGFHKQGMRFDYRDLNAASSGSFELRVGQYRSRIVVNRIGRIRFARDSPSE